MAFDNLTEKLQNVFKNLRGKGRLTEEDVKIALKEVKMALLEADVNFKVVKSFIKAVTEKATVLNAETVTAKDVWDAVKAGDEVAIEVAEQFGKYLGTALANISAIVDPEVFVIGGGVSKAGDVLLDYIKKYYTETAFHGCRETRFELATLGNDAGIYGTAKLIVSVQSH